ncbi:hypothetical protein PM116P4_00041 [Parabacteroides phage PM116P4]|nr:hypothetical protein PM116P4_00041 [Parabacteroides phage PM116P4]WAX17534.1 hypothetical protein PM116P5_00018 [Parabacteroides phage PM116P5]
MEEKFIISEAVSAVSKTWKPKEYTWDEFVAKLSVPVITSETYKEFMSKSKADQSKIKDRGAFVGGELSGGNRNAKNLLSRSVLTLDIDFGNLQFPETFAKATGFACVIHGTHKHSENTPRYRVIAPLSREVNRDEYEALARKVAEVTDIELYDKTTFQYERCMFYPTVSSDVEYFFVEYLGEPLDVDHWLGMYEDWTDVTSWARHEDEAKAVRTCVTEVEMPELKSGLIGEFCRAYTIEEGIETFLSDVYKPSEDTADRYTYLAGESANGLQVFDHSRAFSYQQSDKISDGRAYNIYDLVRVHKFGYLDKDGEVKRSKEAMEELINDDPKVKANRGKEFTLKAMKVGGMTQEQIKEIKAGVDVIIDVEKLTLDNLQRAKNGTCFPTSQNLAIIFTCDPVVGLGAIRENTFTHNFEFAPNRLPSWTDGTLAIDDVDMQHIRNYIDRVYGIANPKKIDDQLAVAARANGYHPVQEYLRELKWDGKPRVETALIEYLGADDNIYTREATRVMLVGAVKRIMQPGCKFDTAMILVGSQGVGKTHFISSLAHNPKWFSNSLTELGSTRSQEAIQGLWLIELAELSAVKKSDTNDVKNFLTRENDQFRGAYKSKVAYYPRQCVFFGSTNEVDFLTDRTGSRRFFPIHVKNIGRTADLYTSEFEVEFVDQLWAEAFYMYQHKVSTLLSQEAEDKANEVRKSYVPVSTYEDDILKYVDMDIPTCWYDDMNSYARREYFEAYPVSKGQYTEFMKMKYVLTKDICVEALGFGTREHKACHREEVATVLTVSEKWTAERDPSRPTSIKTANGRINLIGAFWRI